ncbi:unnamed protein product, partial [Gulo gulo]
MGRLPTCPLCSALSSDPTGDQPLTGTGRSSRWCLVTFHSSGGYFVEFQVGECVCLVFNLRLADPYQEGCRG